MLKFQFLNNKIAAMLAILLLAISFIGMTAGSFQTVEAESAASYYQYDPKRDGGADLPKTSTQDINNWSERKGFEIVSILQKFAQPFCIVTFICGAIMAVAGALFNKRLVPTGLGAMAISGFVYAAILFAPDILDNFIYWIRS